MISPWRPRIGSGMPHPRLMSALGGVWAITPQGWDGLRQSVLSGSAEALRHAVAQLDPERVKARAKHTSTLSMLHDGTEWYFDPTTDAHITGGGIGIFPVRGPLFDRGWCCYQGYDQIVATCEAFALEALARAELKDVPQLQCVIMPMDSPGGMCVGLTGACEALRTLREIVPVYTVSDHCIGSAAEVLAQQATLTFTHRDSSRGHLGTFTDHWDISGMLAKEGIAVTYYELPEGGNKTFFAGETPRSIATDEEYKKAVAHYYAALLEAVTLGRGMPEKTIRDTRAQLYYGHAAIDAGLVDGFATFDDLLYRLEAGEPLPGKDG